MFCRGEFVFIVCRGLNWSSLDRTDPEYGFSLV